MNKSLTTAPCTHTHIGIYYEDKGRIDRYHTISKCSCGKFHINIGMSTVYKPHHGHGFASLAQVQRRVTLEVAKEARSQIKHLKLKIKAEQKILRGVSKLKLSRCKS